MLKRLRRQFVLIIMLIVTLLLFAMMALLYGNTRRELAVQTESIMRAEALSPGGPFRPGEAPEGFLRLDCFTLFRTPDGRVRAIGGEALDLSDEGYLRELYRQAEASGRESGSLSGSHLRFLRVRTGAGMGYAFADTGRERAVLSQLKRSCFIAGSSALLVFFIISLLLARWTVKPVERAWQTQRQFVADASHELKTPLSVILTNAELLEAVGTDRRELSESLLIMARQMRSLVERLLELARSDNAQHTQPETAFDLSALTEERSMIFEPLLYEQGLLLESQVEEGITLQGHRDELAQTVDILLDNAGKHSRAPGTVRLCLRRTAAHRCLLTVETPGEPLSQGDCSRIFQRFYRLDPARSRDGGFGLGLSIAQAVVEGHRGRISAQGIPGGNRFTVELPL